MNKQYNNKKWTTWWSRSQRGLGLITQKCPTHHRIVLKTIPNSQKLRLKFASYYDTQNIVIENIYCFDLGKKYQITCCGQTFYELCPNEDIITDEIEVNSQELIIEYDIITKSGYTCVSGFEYMDYDPFHQAPNQIYALQSIELYSDELKGCLCFFGDSIVEQGNYTRILQKELRERGYSLINLGLSGNRLLKQIQYVNLDETYNKDILNIVHTNQVYKDISLDKQCFGISGLQRYSREVLSCHNIKCIVIAIGVNDIYQPGTFCAHQDELPTLKEMQEGYKQLQNNQNIPMLWCGITPFIGNNHHTLIKEQRRLDNNHWMKKVFDHYIEFDHLFINENKVLKSGLFQDDCLHPTKDGGNLMAKEMMKYLYI